MEKPKPTIETYLGSFYNEPAWKKRANEMPSDNSKKENLPEVSRHS